MHDRVLQRGGESPFGAYRTLSLLFNLGLSAVAVATGYGRRFEAPLALLDLATLGAATHKLALIVTKERVTLPLRSPFTVQADHGREGGHESQPMGHGLRRALGELLTCPHCIAPWIALALVAGHVLAPRPTRAVTTVFSTVALADLLLHMYGKLDAERLRELEQVALTRVERERVIETVRDRAN